MSKMNPSKALFHHDIQTLFDKGFTLAPLAHFQSKGPPAGYFGYTKFHNLVTANNYQEKKFHKYKNAPDSNDTTNAIDLIEPNVALNPNKTAIAIIQKYYYSPEYNEHGRLFVIDADVKRGNGINEALVFAHKFKLNLADTLAVNTPSGGAHWFFYIPLSYFIEDLMIAKGDKDEDTLIEEMSNLQIKFKQDRNDYPNVDFLVNGISVAPPTNRHNDKYPDPYEFKNSAPVIRLPKEIFSKLFQVASISHMNSEMYHPDFDVPDVCQSGIIKDVPIDSKLNIDFVKLWMHSPNVPKAISGENGSSAVYQVANYCFDRALSFHTTIRLIWEEYNSPENCVPTWDANNPEDANEILATVRNALTYRNEPVGSKVQLDEAKAEEEFREFATTGIIPDHLKPIEFSEYEYILRKHVSSGYRATELNDFAKTVFSYNLNTSSQFMVPFLNEYGIPEYNIMNMESIKKVWSQLPSITVNKVDRRSKEGKTRATIVTLPEALFDDSCNKSHGVKFRNVDKVIFHPDKPFWDNGKLNSFTRFSIAPKTYEEISHTMGKDAADFAKETLGYYLEVYSSAMSESDFNWFQAFYAVTLKYPSYKSQTAMIMYSPSVSEGIGKTLSNTIIQKIIGRQFSTTISNPEHLMGQFNEIFEKAVFVAVEDLDFREKNLVNRGYLNTLVTDSIMSINPKGSKQYVAETFFNLSFTTNDPTPIQTGVANRRFAIIPFKPKGGPLEAKERAAKLAARVHDPKYGPAFLALYHKYLLDSDYEIKDIMTPPDNEARSEMLLNSVNHNYKEKGMQINSAFWYYAILGYFEYESEDIDGNRGTYRWPIYENTETWIPINVIGAALGKFLLENHRETSDRYGDITKQFAKALGHESWSSLIKAHKDKPYGTGKKVTNLYGPICNKKEQIGPIYDYGISTHDMIIFPKGPDWRHFLEINTLMNNKLDNMMEAFNIDTDDIDRKMAKTKDNLRDQMETGKIDGHEVRVLAHKPFKV